MRFCGIFLLNFTPHTLSWDDYDEDGINEVWKNLIGIWQLSYGNIRNFNDIFLIVTLWLLNTIRGSLWFYELGDLFPSLMTHLLLVFISFFFIFTLFKLLSRCQIVNVYHLFFIVRLELNICLSFVAFMLSMSFFLQKIFHSHETYTKQNRFHFPFSICLNTLKVSLPRLKMKALSLPYHMTLHTRILTISKFVQKINFLCHSFCCCCVLSREKRDRLQI